MTQSQAFKRAKEWAALSFGSIDAAMHYEDEGSGKLIFKGWTTVWYSATFKNIWGNVKSFPEDRQILFSLVITLKNGKAKMEFRNLRYKHKVPGAVVGNIYVPTQEYEYPMMAAFPLAMTAPATWRGTVDLLNKTLAAMGSHCTNLEKHIKALIEDYEF